MFGTRDEFHYVECHECGCLQIAEVPTNLGRYYPSKYFREPDDWLLASDSYFKSLLKRRRAGHYLNKRTLLGAWLARKFYPPACIDWDWFRNAQVGLNSAILDVGCGTGSLLLRLQKEGFANLTGVDPFIDRDRAYGAVRVKKATVAELDRQFDLVMSHHSFEHVSDPLDMLRQMKRILRPGGSALIRIPVAGSFAWKHYGVDWVQLDAPRHLFLHTRRSMELLAQEARLSITNVIFDSTEFQFWGSEQYRRGIALVSPESHFVNPSKSSFSEAELEEFRARATELNNRGEGDSACYYLRHAAP